MPTVTTTTVQELGTMIIKDYYEESEEEQTFAKDLWQEMAFAFLRKFLASLDEMQGTIAS